jgi:hypothetical protein
MHGDGILELAPGFTVDYLNVDGHRRREALRAVVDVAFEQALQVRPFRLSAGSATTPACGGRQRPARMWVLNPGWNATM